MQPEMLFGIIKQHLRLFSRAGLCVCASRQGPAGLKVLACVDIRCVCCSGLVCVCFPQREKLHITCMFLLIIYDLVIEAKTYIIAVINQLP